MAKKNRRPYNDKELYGPALLEAGCAGCIYVYMEALRRHANACTCKGKPELTDEGACPARLERKK